MKSKDRKDSPPRKYSPGYASLPAELAPIFHRLAPRHVSVLFELSRPGSCCWYTQANIAKRTGKSLSTIRRALYELEWLGVLTVTRCATDDGKQTSNTYMLGDGQVDTGTKVDGKKHDGRVIFRGGFTNPELVKHVVNSLDHPDLWKAFKAVYGKKSPEPADLDLLEQFRWKRPIRSERLEPVKLRLERKASPIEPAKPEPVSAAPSAPQGKADIKGEAEKWLDSRLRNWMEGTPLRRGGKKKLLGLCIDAMLPLVEANIANNLDPDCDDVGSFSPSYYLSVVTGTRNNADVVMKYGEPDDLTAGGDLYSDIEDALVGKPPAEYVVKPWSDDDDGELVAFNSHRETQGDDELAATSDLFSELHSE